MRLTKIDINNHESDNVDIVKSGGSLTIFTAYTPGAGKTYLMISRAMEEKNNGKKVEIGFFNDSHRSLPNLPEDDELMVQLKEKCVQSVDGHGKKHHIKYSLDDIISRKPDLVLMDEIGMCNMNTDEFSFVYEDVERLLDSGIDVYATVNLKRFDSANPLFKQVTGIGIRNTVPDRILDRADHIVFVDRRPRLLIEDFRKGKLFNDRYMKSKIMRTNFRHDTLVAYRKISKEYLKNHGDKVEVVTR